MTNSLDDMVEFDLRDRGIQDENLLAAFRKVDRKSFVQPIDLERAYDDRALPLTHGQTISQPYMVALALSELQLTGTERVLEIGTGSGYQTALLAHLCAEVWTVERIEPLATTAEDRLLDMHFKNIRFLLSDGSLGWAEGAPYDRIIVSAACPRMPQPLVEQLAEGGIIVAPVGSAESQDLIIGTKKMGELITRKGTSCLFVKLVGEEGFEKGSPS